MRALQAQLPRGLSERAAAVSWRLGQSGNLGLNGRNARELAGPVRPGAKGAGPWRRRGGCGGSGHRRRALQRSGTCTAVLIPLPPTRRGFETRPPARCLFS